MATTTVRAVFGDIARFSRAIAPDAPLRPYQVEPARAIIRSVLQRRGLTFTVMMSRQAGKNELSAQLEAYLLSLFQRRGGTIVKAAPTFIPQIVNSKRRLEDRLERSPLTRGRWRGELGRGLALGRARVIFFSAAPESQVVGATASLLLEIDEAQDVDIDKYQKDFRPMGATGNVTTVLYGTPWDSANLLERTKAENLALEARDGIKRHFEYPWTAVAAHNPLYGRYVEGEIARLGADHPIIQTQYLLHALEALGRLFTPDQLALLRGSHPRQLGPTPGRVYVAGVDVAGGVEADPDQILTARATERDRTVVTVAAVDWRPATTESTVLEPHLQVVAHYAWQGEAPSVLHQRVLALLRDHWRCTRIVVDATGVGGGLASYLTAALSTRVVESFTFTAASKSELGYGLLAAVNGARVRLYHLDEERDDTARHWWRTCWRELELARRELRANQTLSFFVPPQEGHDDYLMSLALTVRAASGAAPRAAVGRARTQEDR